MSNFIITYKDERGQPMCFEKFSGSYEAASDLAIEMIESTKETYKLEYLIKEKFD